MIEFEDKKKPPHFKCEGSILKRSLKTYFTSSKSTSVTSSAPASSASESDSG